jgi:hypothetical protein
MPDKFLIYALRDRLLDYYQQPFIATDTKAVLAALSELINNPESSHAITQAPHHYELFQVGAVTDDGHVYGKHELVCDCSSLIRERIRERTESGNGSVPRALERSQSPLAEGVAPGASHPA